MNNRQQNTYHIFLSIVIIITFLAIFFYHKSKNQQNIEEINKFGNFTVGELTNKISRGRHFSDIVVVRYFVDNDSFEVKENVKRGIVGDREYFFIKYSYVDPEKSIILYNYNVPALFQNVPANSWDSIEFYRAFANKDL